MWHFIQIWCQIRWLETFAIGILLNVAEWNGKKCAIEMQMNGFEKAEEMDGDDQIWIYY